MVSWFLRIMDQFNNNIFYLLDQHTLFVIH